MIVATWLTAVADPHYGQTCRPADFSELKVLDTLGEHAVTVIADQLPDSPIVFRVESLGGNPYHDRWRQLAVWLATRDPAEFVWSVDANDVTLLNDPYPDWLCDHTLYVGSEPVDGPNARSLGFWWMTGLHPDHADWLTMNADKPLLNAGLLGGRVHILRDFVDDLVDQLDGCSDVTDMAAVNFVLYERWADRYVTGHPVHTPMWSFATADPAAIWAHK